MNRSMSFMNPHTRRTLQPVVFTAGFFRFSFVMDSIVLALDYSVKHSHARIT